MKILGVIPARMASTRFPGKPLALIKGVTLIERVWRQAQQAKSFSELVIATDSPEIEAFAGSIGAPVVMTSHQARTGSDRVAEVVEHYKKKFQEFSLIANVQGDMPFINPVVIDAVVDSLKTRSSEVGMATIGTPIQDREEFFRNSVVKVVTSQRGEALYFSRAPIPYPRNEPIEGEPFGLKHLGLYVFRPETLKMLSSLSSTVPEDREGLEQLRLLCHGIRIHVEIVDRKSLEPSVEVDTPEDLRRAEALI